MSLVRYSIWVLAVGSTAQVMAGHLHLSRVIHIRHYYSTWTFGDLYNMSPRLVVYFIHDASVI
jgi:hypothetical protein